MTKLYSPTIAEVLALLRKATKALDNCGFGQKNGDTWELPMDYWEDAMAMRDEIDEFLRKVDAE